MKTTDFALAPVNKLTFLLGVGAIVVAIVYGECPPRPVPTTEALMPPSTNQRINDLRGDVNQRFDAVDQRVDDLRAHVDGRFDDLRALIVSQK